MSEEHVREASLGLLTGYLGPIVDAIVGSADHCPPAMRLAFQQLRRRVEERFPQAEHQVGTETGMGMKGMRARDRRAPAMLKAQQEGQCSWGFWDPRQSP